MHVLSPEGSGGELAPGAPPPTTPHPYQQANLTTLADAHRRVWLCAVSVDSADDKTLTPFNQPTESRRVSGWRGETGPRDEAHGCVGVGGRAGVV